MSAGPDRPAARIEPVDPDSPAARAAMTEYFGEIDSTFDGGFDPGPEDLDPFRPPHGLFLVALDGDLAVGSGALRTIGDGIAEVKRMWVRPTWRGTGLGGRLLRELEAAASARGDHLVRLDTNDTLHAAIGLYRRAGYTEVPRYNDNPYAQHWFEKGLS